MSIFEELNKTMQKFDDEAEINDEATEDETGDGTEDEADDTTGDPTQPTLVVQQLLRVRQAPENGPIEFLVRWGSVTGNGSMTNGAESWATKETIISRVPAGNFDEARARLTLRLMKQFEDAERQLQYLTNT